jgi:hypothetical protein
MQFPLTINQGEKMHSLILGAMLAACPDLSGNYSVCNSETGSFSSSMDLVITQSVQNRAMTYVLTSTDPRTHERTSETYIADGRTRTQTERDPDTGASMSLSNQVRCVGPSVVTKTVLTYDGETAYSVVTTMTKEGSRLTQVITGSNMDNEINETIVCR